MKKHRCENSFECAPTRPREYNHIFSLWGRDMKLDESGAKNQFFVEMYTTKKMEKQPNENTLARVLRIRGLASFYQNKKIKGQWLWHSWQSGRLQHQMTRVRLQS